MSTKISEPVSGKLNSATRVNVENTFPHAANRGRKDLYRGFITNTQRPRNRSFAFPWHRNRRGFRDNRLHGANKREKPRGQRCACNYAIWYHANFQRRRSAVEVVRTAQRDTSFSEVTSIHSHAGRWIL